jgi:hypothetical protein
LIDKKRIVFVLGAGASIPYGFPSGAELRDELCAADRASELARQLHECCGVSIEATARFSDAFLRSGLNSIDAFLSRRTDFAQIGKLAIALQLCMREHASTVVRVNNADNWYRTLWNVMSARAHAPDDLPLRSVRFVTFNYDRSLEYFFHEAIKGTFKIADEPALAVLSKLNILHVYGTLGEFAHSEQSRAPNARIYTTELTGSKIELAASQIRVIPETRLDDKCFQVARTWFDWADDICFLGFGFDPLNMERLGIDSVIEARVVSSKKNPPNVTASLFGKTRAEADQIGTSMGLVKSWNPLFEKNVMTLRSSSILH